MPDKSNDGHERRRAIRRQCKVYVGMTIQVCIAGDWSDDSFEVNGRLLDINTSGAKFFTKEDFEKGQQLRLRILMPGQPEVLTEALVCWDKPIPDKNGFATGVKFRKLTDESASAIDAFLATLDQ